MVNTKQETAEWRETKNAGKNDLTQPEKGLGKGSEKATFAFVSEG
jgi:hypothetical protein